MTEIVNKYDFCLLTEVGCFVLKLRFLNNSETSGIKMFKE